MKRVLLSVRDQMMARLVAEEVAKAIGAMLDERDAATPAAREARRILAAGEEPKR
jgi:hypothetical protein